MDLLGKKVLVIGTGITGISSILFLLKKGAKVVVIDKNNVFSKIKKFKVKFANISNNFEFKKYNLESLKDIELVLPSPGIFPSNIIIQEAIHQNIPIISDIDLAAFFFKKPIIAITGTNGKTTTTNLVGNFLKSCGKSTFIGGNIGVPALELVNQISHFSYAVFEISSFQLQWIKTFHPIIATLLNISIDHLDYHGNFDNYQFIKEKIFHNQDKNNLAILNANNYLSNNFIKKLKSKIIFFSSTDKINNGIYIYKKKIILSTKEFDEFYPIDKIKFIGKHNLENLMAAIIIGRYCGCHRDKIIENINTFRGIKHRIEYITTKKYISFYNDSKATNIGAVIRALEIFEQPIILMLGGKDKGGNFENLIDLITKKVKLIVTFGEARNRINSILGNIIEVRNEQSLQKAINIAYQAAEPGDVILLSPGCASFDEFKNYVERGNFFKKWVKILK